MIQELTCITCPMGCTLEADWIIEDEKTIVRSVRGNTCPRGEAYARAELTNPTRMVTSTVMVTGAPYRRLPVVTSFPVPKDKIPEIMEAIHRTHVTAPIRRGDIILSQVCGLQADIIASRSMESIQ